MYFTIVFTIFGSSLSSARAPCSRAGDTTACAFPTPSATLFRIDAAENPIVPGGKDAGQDCSNTDFHGVRGAYKYCRRASALKLVLAGASCLIGRLLRSQGYASSETCVKLCLCIWGDDFLSPKKQQDRTARCR